MDVLSEIKKIKRKVKRRVVTEVYGETKGERWNRKRLKLAQEAWSRYSGPLSYQQFMSEWMGNQGKN